MKNISSFNFKLLFLLFLFFVAKTAIAQNLTDSIIDTRDGQIYKTVKIGDSFWMAENLNFKTLDSWSYNNIEENRNTYGRLYTWDVALNACPFGWQLPTDEDWQNLDGFFGLSEEGLKQSGWRGDSIHIASKLNSQLNNRTEIPQFNVLFSGYRKHAQIVFFIHKISFAGIGKNSGFWTSTKKGNNAYYRYFENDKSGIFRYSYFHKAGFSVRCVKSKE